MNINPFINQANPIQKEYEPISKYNFSALRTFNLKWKLRWPENIVVQFKSGQINIVHVYSVYIYTYMGISWRLGDILSRRESNVIAECVPRRRKLLT